MVLAHHLQLSYTDKHQKIQIAYSKNCLSTFNFVSVSFFPLLLCIPAKSKTKLKKKNRRNKVEHKFANIQTAFDFFMNTCIKGPI